MVVFLGCTDKVRTSNFAGTYVFDFRNEFSITSDTLIVSKDGSSNGNFFIERRSGFQKIRNGLLKDKEYKSVKWEATYDSNKSILIQSDFGKQVKVSLEHNTLQLGTSDYKKLK